MKKSVFLPLLLLAIFFFTPASVEVFHDQVRLPAAVPRDCAQLVESFLKDERPRLTFPRGSLFAKFPAVAEEMDKLEFTPLKLEEFYDEFFKQYKRAPTLKEALEYIYVLRKEIISSYDEVIRDVEGMQNPNLKPFIDELIFSRDKLDKFKDLDLYESELAASHEAGKSKLASLDEPIVKKNNTIDSRYLNYLKDRSREGNFNGEMGELLALGASKDKTIKKGLKFETRQLTDPIPYQVVITKAMAKFEASLAKKTDQQLIKLVRTYGDGILRAARIYLESMGEDSFDRDVLISKIITMIRTKEIDLVFEKSDGRIVWGEVKAYKKPISLEILNGGGYKAKPMVDQLMEHKALRDILGFKDSVDLRFISPTSKITPEAKRLIESLGYEVIGAK